MRTILAGPVGVEEQQLDGITELEEPDLIDREAVHRREVTPFDGEQHDDRRPGGSSILARLACPRLAEQAALLGQRLEGSKRSISSATVGRAGMRPMMARRPAAGAAR